MGYRSGRSIAVCFRNCGQRIHGVHRLRLSGNRSLYGRFQNFRRVGGILKCRNNLIGTCGDFGRCSAGNAADVHDILRQLRRACCGLLRRAGQQCPGLRHRLFEVCGLFSAAAHHAGNSSRHTDDGGSRGLRKGAHAPRQPGCLVLCSLDGFRQRRIHLARDPDAEF